MIFILVERSLFVELEGVVCTYNSSSFNCVFKYNMSRELSIVSSVVLDSTIYFSFIIFLKYFIAVKYKPASSRSTATLYNASIFSKRAFINSAVVCTRSLFILFSARQAKPSFRKNVIRNDRKVGLTGAQVS